MMRCKFKVTHVQVSEDGQGSLAMEPVYSGSPENESFFKYTPAGSFSIGVVKGEQLAGIAVGQEFYIDLSPAGR